jgi:hypothetical protein
MIYKISPEFYIKVTEKLLAELDQKEYYSGSFEFDYEDVICKMVLSAVIYYQDVFEDGTFRRKIRDVIPVWWELHTEIDGQECLNDFSFNLLREYVKEL